jgi:3-deoxy-D-manno-octulosonate 8-phosphate phosphatase (KDO 8-P phosphatase)
MTLKRTKLFIVDVDGTLTDGKIYLDGAGNEIKAFSAHDGSALKLLQQAGIRIAFITGRESPAVERRARELGIDEVHQGVGNKIAVLTDLLEKYNLNLDQVAFIGDDFNDLPIMRQVGYSFGVANARETVKEFAHFTTAAEGGNGAVSEAVVKILKAQGLYEKVINQFLE